MTDPDQTSDAEDRPDASRPSFDLGSISRGPMLFASGAFLILEIGGSIASARTTLPGRLERFSSGALTVEAVVAAIEIGLIVALLALERVHPEAGGITFRQIPRGVLIGVSLWALCQLGIAIVAIGRHGSLSLYVGWAQPAAMFAPLLERFLTDVFAEELFWRGLFFVWILRVLERRSWHDPLSRLGAALLGSQILFGISRLPGQVLEGGSAVPPGVTLVVFTMTGIFYALLYLRTGNLWLVMTVHAFAMWPLPIFAFDLDPSKLMVLISAVLLIPTSTRRPGGVNEPTTAQIPSR